MFFHLSDNHLHTTVRRLQFLQAIRRLRHVAITMFLGVCVSNLFIGLIRVEGKPSEGVTPPVLHIQRTELLNGLRVISVERPGEMAVINLLVKTGSFSDPKDKVGLANLTAQSACFANGKLPLQRWKDELEFLGASIEIQSTMDSTIFQAKVRCSNIDAILQLFARLVIQPVFIPEGIERIKCELSSSKLTISEPQAIAELNLGELVFGRTGCGRAESGTQESVKPLRAADVESFHQAHYLPNNTALIIVGGPPLARLGDLVREKFGSWIKGKLQPLDPPIGPSPVKPVVRVIDQRTSADALILLGHSAPPRQTPDFFALTVANTLLGGMGKSSRLEQAFAKREIPYQTVASRVQLMQTCGRFEVSAKVPLSAVPAAFAAILQGIEDLKTQAVPEPELSQAKLALLSKHRASLETEAGIADQLTAIELFDLARDLLTGFPLRVDQVSSERVQETAKNYLSSTQISGVVLGESQAVRAGLVEFRSFEISEVPESSQKRSSAH